VFGADGGTALGDIAEADAILVLEIVPAIFNIQWMHFERSGVNHVSGTSEFFMQVVVA
jgi:hypothetical protein